MPRVLFIAICALTSSFSNISCESESFRPFHMTHCMDGAFCPTHIDESIEVEERVERIGAYVESEEYFTSEHFPSEGHEIYSVDLTFVYFGRSVTTEEALLEIHERCLEPGELIHLLSFAEQYPRSYVWAGPIVSLGTVTIVVEGESMTPCLDVMNDRLATRKLVLMKTTDEWQDNTRFIAVRTEGSCDY